MSMSLGLRGLPVAEVGLVKSIVRLSSMLTDAWTVSDDGKGDLVVLESQFEAELEPGTTVVKIAKDGVDVPGPVLRRPIRAEELVALLNAETSRRASTSMHAPQKAVPAPVAPAPQASGIRPGASARLRRWPSWNLLKDDRAYLRMATMLSSAALTVDRLSELSGARRDACLAFMRHMDAHQLLVWTDAPATEPVAAFPADGGAQQPSHAVASATASGRKAGAGLFHSLRRKLGLAGAA